MATVQPNGHDVEMVEYGETIGFPIWFTVLFCIVITFIISYNFKYINFDQLDQNASDDIVEMDEDELNSDNPEECVKISEKLKKKREKKKAERAQKELEKKEKEEKLKKYLLKQAEYEKKYNEREEKLIQQALEIEMEEKKIFDELKSKIVVEDDGYVEEDFSQSDVLDFIRYIKYSKRVNIEDLAAFTGLKSNNCVDRINELEASNRIFGITNTQGFYLYINEKEIDEFCSFINYMGRIHKQYDLVSACNRIFRLTPLDEDKEEIKLIYNKRIPPNGELDPIVN